LLVALGSLPDEITRFLNMFNSSEGLERLNSNCRHNKDGSRETNNQKIARFLKVPVMDFETTLRTLLGVET